MRTRNFTYLARGPLIDCNNETLFGNNNKTGSHWKRTTFSEINNYKVLERLGTTSMEYNNTKHLVYKGSIEREIKEYKYIPV